MASPAEVDDLPFDHSGPSFLDELAAPRAERSPALDAPVGEATGGKGGAVGHEGSWTRSPLPVDEPRHATASQEDEREGRGQEARGEAGEPLPRAKRTGGHG